NAATSNSEINAAALELATYLIKPLESQLSGDDPLWVELDDVLLPTPIAVPPFRSGELLSERFPTSLFPGVAYLERTGQPGPQLPTGAALVVGISSLPPTSHFSLAPLPAAVEEARFVA